MSLKAFPYYYYYYCYYNLYDSRFCGPQLETPAHAG